MDRKDGIYVNNESRGTLSSYDTGFNSSLNYAVSNPHNYFDASHKYL